MNDNIAIENIESVLSREVLLPTVVLWNRLEGRPRTQDFTRALRAEVRDPLWMLCKQWQVGEFRGDDAGSPVFAKVHMSTTEINRFKPGDAAARPADPDVPLEALVEQRPIPFFSQQHVLSLDICVAMGQQWVKLLASIGQGALRQLFLDHYTIDAPSPNSRNDAPLTAHPSVWQSLTALAGRAMDGAKLYFHLKADAAHRANDGMAVPDPVKPALDALAEKFVRWYEALFYQPVNHVNDAWVGRQLEYQFAVSAPKDGAEKVMTAEEYYHGHLDWYSLDVDPSIETPDTGANGAESREDAFTVSFFPTAIQFEGMPNTRWWAFEDGKTNFGDIKPDTTDLDKLLLMEFGLVYANDWFMVPVQLPTGSLASVAGLAVTNVFGERIWVTASGAGADEDWQRWAMYNLSVRGDEATTADTTLVLLPTVPKIQESAPFDDVLPREGLNATPAQPYFLHEEEVPRAGVSVTQSFQRTRWHDGRVFTWVGVRKQTGRGEGRGGLAFDRVEPTQRRGG